MSKNPSLKTWPEAIRAILLATANYQRADGAARAAAEGAVVAAVNAARSYGVWAKIGAVLGTSGEAARQRYGQQAVQLRRSSL